ncbi:MAG: DUF2778 domain-containing protein [Trinickia sp.]|uniref:DUF2778 domain-containing protein n=1 Tax=Trinickia sp. TaxID=2571163 RepID=UPI003F7E7D21
MPVNCTFALNDQTTSLLNCQGIGAFVAYSGRGAGRDNPGLTDKKDVGPIPKGVYYIVDRQSGGRLGWLYDLIRAHGWGTTDHSQWFMLWNKETGDSTFVNGVARGQFRLHPEGRLRLSEGCITLANPYGFNSLAKNLRARGADLPVPGTAYRAYGTVEVK